MMKIYLTISALTLSFGMGAAQALPPAPYSYEPARLSAGADAPLVLVGEKNYKPKKFYKKKRRVSRRGGSNQLQGNGGHVMDTCPGGDQACINDLKANCDKAGGGLSTEPDGGVDCFVVGIHDQPDQSD